VLRLTHTGIHYGIFATPVKKNRNASNPSTLDEIARNKIRLWIVGSGLTQVEIATRVGRTPGWLSRYLKGEFDADLEQLKKFTLAFKVPFFALFEEPGSSPDEARLLADFRAAGPEGRQLILNAAEFAARPPGTNRARRGSSDRHK
jgi:transcriptional regulator with XRE-family HTH domain